jgi:hypothetical protein
MAVQMLQSFEVLRRPAKNLRICTSEEREKNINTLFLKFCFVRIFVTENVYCPDLQGIRHMQF